MTVIRPNSISGITSLTAHRGSIDFYAHDGSAARFDNINSNVTSGVSTFASLNITGDLDVGGALTYEDVTNVDSIGIVTARAGVKVPDSQKIFLGTGDDLQIYHDGSNSYIDDTGTGRLNIRGNTGVSLRNYSDSEQFINCYTNGTVELFYDNAKKFETTTTGVTVTNDLVCDGTGDKAIRWSTSGTNKWSLYHNNGAGALVAFDNANNAERLRIDSSGRILIGLNSSLLSYAGLQIKGDADNGAHICLANKTAAPTSGQNIGSIRFTNNAGGIGALIGVEGDGTWSGSSYPSRFIFATTASGATSGTERLRITSGGDMGLGTASPTARLDVRRDDTDGKIAEFHQSTGYGIQIRSSESVATIRAEYNQALVFETGTTATERLRIESNGYVKTNSEFWVGGGASPVLRWRDGSNEYATARINSGNLYFEVAGTEKLRIRSDGKLMTQSAGYIYTTSSAGSLSLYGGNTNLGGGIVLSGGNADGDIRFYAQMSTATPAERLRIKSDGKIGINASSGWNAYGDVLLVQANTGATEKAMISVRGGSTGYCHSALKLSATTNSNSGGNQRGLGVFMHDESSNVEWYAGRPYATSDYFLITRNTGVTAANAGQSTAQHSMRKWQVDSSGRTVQNGGIYTYQPGQTSGAKTSRAIEAKGASGTYSQCVIDVAQHSYGSVAWDIKVGGYHSAHQHVAGTYYCNGALYANYTSINNSVNVSYTRAFTSNQTVRHTFYYHNGFVHPTCEVTATCGGDGYLEPGDITITWS